jgi:hypothetical protein
MTEYNTISLTRNEKELQKVFQSVDDNENEDSECKNGNFENVYYTST